MLPLRIRAKILTRNSASDLLIRIPMVIRVLFCAVVFGCGTTPSSPPTPPGMELPDSSLMPDSSPEPTEAPPFLAFREFSNFTTTATGALLSPVVETQASFRDAIASWNADTPAGAWIELDLRARIAGRWTDDYVMGVWTSQDDATHRHSVDGQTDANGTVDTDTLRLNAAADAWQMTIKLHGGAHLRMVSVITTDPSATPAALAPLPGAYGVAADVPERSQMIYPNGGEVWCSPTSISMLLAFWGTNESVPTAASSCYSRPMAAPGTGRSTQRTRPPPAAIRSKPS